MQYIWSLYCEKPVSEDDRLTAIFRLYRGAARVIAIRHVGQLCTLRLQQMESGLPEGTNELATRVFRSAIIMGAAHIYDGDEAVLYVLELETEESE